MSKKSTILKLADVYESKHDFAGGGKAAASLASNNGIPVVPRPRAVVGAKFAVIQ